MGRIDQETVNRILDAADIVDVVSDFVQLKRRGANYIGLCPFHNERTPSFSVSRAKGLCKCFSCGKGGSPVGFLMELEQMSYVDALKYLARKYNIEIKEREMTDAEREAATERESLLAVNAFALDYFEKNLLNEPDGRAIGLSYFRERGINDAAIKRFHLGYSLEARDGLYKAAIAAGYSEKYLVDAGLCIRNDRGQVYDRFKGRVIYPVFSVSGKVVAFGGRTLRSDKAVAKYVNSPESVIYSKSHELYGLYQAKQAIVRQNKCILVEGYMDVISMSQSGIENVVASSGTSLTDGQIRLIHRFTDQVTVIYDSDPAGIKASLRGIDMLLAEGMKIKVLLLPQGDDPDSFAQAHTLEQIEQYIRDNETDFIRFKTHILLEGATDDPIKRASVISDIVKSIACIPDAISRIVYVGECSRLLQVDEKILKLEVEKQIALRLEAAGRPAQRPELITTSEHSVTESTTPSSRPAHSMPRSAADVLLVKCERDLLRYILKYGAVDFCETLDDEGNPIPMKLLDYVVGELAADSLSFSVPSLLKTYQAACEQYFSHWREDYSLFANDLNLRRNERWTVGQESIKAHAVDLSDITAREHQLEMECDEFYATEISRYSCDYLESRLASSPDDDVRSLTLDLVSEKHQLSKLHTKYAKVEGEKERLIELVPKAIAALKDAHLARLLARERERLAALDRDEPGYEETLQDILKQIDSYTRLRMELARNLGERVIMPWR